MRASSSSSNSLTSWPFSQYWPFVGESRQPIRFIRVDLPDPDGPMMATYSLCSMRRFTPRKACTCCSEPMSYVFHKSTVEIMDDSGAPDTTGCEIFKTSAAAIFLSWSFGDKCPLPSDVRSTPCCRLSIGRATPAKVMTPRLLLFWEPYYLL